tara:strand:- start:277 stop:441 length:165 start_codon:yes stop_codon:yes gene_type:complete
MIKNNIIIFPSKKKYICKPVDKIQEVEMQRKLLENQRKEILHQRKEIEKMRQND